MEIKEALEELLQHQEELARQVSIIEGHIVVNVAYEYNIPLSRCRNYEEILGWTIQLSEKTWITREVLRYFMFVACKANNLEIPHS